MITLEVDACRVVLDSQRRRLGSPRRSPASRARPHRLPRRAAATSSMSSTLAGIAGRWLQVPPGGTLAEDGIPQARAAEAAKPAKKATALPKKPPQKAAPMGDLD